MRSIIFEVTQRCNHDCLYCYNVWKAVPEYPRGELDTEGTLRLIDRVLRETKPQVFSFSGGEPLLRDDLLELIRFVRRQRVAVNLLTNGSLLTDDTIEACVGAGVSLFEVPLLSTKREQHNYLTQSSSWDRVLEAIPTIKLNRNRVVTVLVVTEVNADQTYGVVELSFALGADAVMVNRFNPGGTGLRHLDELLLTPQSLTRALDDAERAAEEFRMPVSCSVTIPPCVVETSGYKHLTFGYCAAGTERAYYTVDALGNVRMCNHSPLILGNILQEPFRHLARGPLAQQFVADVPEFCTPCRLAAVCQGGCKAAAEQACGDRTQLEPFLDCNATLASGRRLSL